MINTVTPPYIDYAPTDGVTLTYVFPFELLQATDLNVYFTAAGQAYDPIVDLIPSNDYTVAINSSPLAGGEITFTTAPVAGGTLVIVRNMPDELTTAFANIETFSGKALDTAFHRLLLLIQQNSFVANDLALHYPINAPGILNGLTQVAVLENGQYWKRLGNAIVGVYPTPGDEDTLRSELASQVSGGDGATLVGVYDNTNNVGQTLDVALNDLIAKVANMWDARPVLGTVEFGHFTAAKTGWLLVTSYGTIGSQDSEATLLNSATAEELFKHYWNTFSNDLCPVVEGRGASADIDWAANKKIFIPNFIGRAVGVVGTPSYAQTVVPDFVNSNLGVNAGLPLYDVGTVVRLQTTGTMPTGLLADTDYYVIPVSSTNIRLAINPTNAHAGTQVTFTDNGTGVLTVIVKNTFHNLGEFAGYETHSLSADEGPYHNHSGVPSYASVPAIEAGGVQDVLKNVETPVSTTYSGQNLPHPNVPPTAYFNAQIYLGHGDT
jgi:hypothetical protein